jgi:hypothetical protein
MVCNYVIETFAESNAVLVIDETGFLKRVKPRVELNANTQAQPARSVTERGCVECGTNC